MTKILFSLMLALGFAAPLANASQNVPFSQRCAWAPNHPEVCEARKYCTPNPANKRCAVYCHVNPRDVVCGEVYQRPLPPTEPGYDTPYPWARSGTFCEENPGNISCAHDDWWWGY